MALGKRERLLVKSAQQMLLLKMRADSSTVVNLPVETPVTIERQITLVGHANGSVSVEATGTGLGYRLNDVQFRGKTTARAGDVISVGDGLELLVQTVTPIPASAPFNLIAYAEWERRCVEEIQRARRFDRTCLILAIRTLLPFSQWFQSLDSVSAPFVCCSQLSEHEYVFIFPEGTFQGASELLRAAQPLRLAQAEFPTDGISMDNVWGKVIWDLLEPEGQRPTDELIAVDPVMSRILDWMEKGNSRGTPVTFLGEGGVGKHLFSRTFNPPKRAEALEVSQVYLPPLRNRADDLKPLADYFLARCRKALARPRLAFAPATVAVLQKYRWPGNVRELKNAVTVAAIRSKGNELKVESLPASITSAVQREEESAAPGVDLKQALRETEREVFLSMLTKTQWNVTEAAKRLSLPRRTMVYRLSHLGIRRPK